MRPIVRLLIGLGLAACILLVYAQRTSSDLFKPDPSNTTRSERWGGIEFTASSVSGIEALISRQPVSRAQSPNCDPSTILWLGNSQLHFINQIQPGDHLAPYWLRHELDCDIPLGMSLPNANLQELYVLAAVAMARLPTRTILLELCFDDLREDGLRGDFSGFLTPAARKRVAASSTGRGILARADAVWGKADAMDERDGLRGFAQKAVEEKLDEGLGEIWPLWKDRAKLRQQVLLDAYMSRNALLGIDATTIRKMIEPRYARNMAALRQLLQDAQSNDVAVVAYIAPIRQGVALPYEAVEYARWKSEAARMASEYGAVLVNLEKLVPPAHWGATAQGDIDFMHFRGEGHKLLARGLLPHVQGVR